MRMIDILPEHVRAWVARLRDAGVTPVTIRYNKVLLSAIFTTALNDQVVFLHPCRGVKIPTVPQKPRAIITPEQFGCVYDALPDDTMRLLAETKIETGLRWGELTELRVRDIDFPTRMLTVSRAVVEVNAKFHPAGGRFLVKDYPKDGEYRRAELAGERRREHHNVHIALSAKSTERPALAVPGKPWLATEPVPGDVPAARWEAPVTVRRDADGFDFSGPYVRGDRADRHLFLAWGDVHSDGTLRLIRGSKLGLGRVAPGVSRKQCAPGTGSSPGSS